MEQQKTDLEQQVLHLINELLLEIGNERARRAIKLDAFLDRDLGLDSLGKVELFHRIENVFHVNLPDHALIDIATINDLVKALSHREPIKIPEYKKEVIQLKKVQFDSSYAATFVDVLIGYANSEPDRPHIYLQDEQGNEEIITYSQLLLKATRVANGIIAERVEPGATIAIMLPTSNEFFYAFFGILIAGCIPVPIYPPFKPNAIEEYAIRESVILANAEVRLLITFKKAKALSQILKSFIPSLRRVVT